MPTTISSTSITFPDDTIQETAFPLPGSIVMWPPGVNIPSGYVECNGASLDANANPKYEGLFQIIGTRYGGSSKSNFNVPNLTGESGNIGSSPIGSATMPANTIPVDGSPTMSGGANTLTNRNIVHRHTFSRSGFLANLGGTAADNGNSTSLGLRDTFNQLTTEAAFTPSPLYPSYTTVLFLIRH